MIPNQTTAYGNQQTCDLVASCIKTDLCRTPRLANSFYASILVQMCEIKPKWHYQANCLHQAEKKMLTDKIPEPVEQLFPRCVVYLRLSGSSWALFQKKITQTKQLSLFGRLWKPPWAPGDAFSADTHRNNSCHSVDIYFFPRHFFSFSLISMFRLIWFSPLFPSTSVSAFSHLRACQIKGKQGSAVALIDGKLET